MSRIFEKLRRAGRKGFTLMEMLIVVGIIVILGGIATASVLSVNRNLTQKELDDKAQIIYDAVQARLTQLSASGQESLYSATSLTESAKVKDVNTAEAVTVGEKLYYLSKPGATLSVELGSSATLAAIVPAGTFDGELYGNTWIAEIVPETSTVYSVFYAEEKGKGNLSSALDGNTMNDLRTLSNRKGKYVGYYDGGAGDITITNKARPTEITASVKIINSDELFANLSYTLPTDEAYQGNIVRTVTISDGTTEVIWSDNDPLTKDKIDAIFGSGTSGTLLLDSLEEGKGFSDLFGIYGLIPGRNITVTLAVSSDNPKVKDATASDTANSLFDNATSGSEAVITNPRHLQNLDEDSGVNEEIKEAKLGDNIIFDPSEPGGPTNFEPINNPNLEKFDGNDKKIENLNAGSDPLTGGSGLFDQFSGDEIKDLTLVNPQAHAAETYGTDPNAGALMATYTGPGLTVSDCYVYLEGTGITNAATTKAEDADIDDKLDDIKDKAYIVGLNSGGLIGLVRDGDVKIQNSSASTVVYSRHPSHYPTEFASNYPDDCGGLIGASLKNVTLEKSYADSYLFGNTGESTISVGGLVGSSTTTVSLSDCFAAGFAKGPACYGLVDGEITGSSSYSILTDGKGKAYALSDTTLPAGSTILTASQIADKVQDEEDDAAVKALGTAWETTTSSDPYNLDGGNRAVYPYPTLKGIPQHGDWDRNLLKGTSITFWWEDGSAKYDYNVKISKGDEEPDYADGDYSTPSQKLPASPQSAAVPAFEQDMPGILADVRIISEASLSVEQTKVYLSADSEEPIEEPIEETTEETLEETTEDNTGINVGVVSTSSREFTLAATTYTITLDPAATDTDWGSSKKTVTVTNKKASYSLSTVPSISRPGYVLSGWYTKASGGTEILYKSGLVNLVGAVKEDWSNSWSTQWKKDGTLYAHWDANKYSVDFDRNGGSGVMTNQSMTYGKSESLKSNSFYRDGYDFAGWSTTPGGEVVYSDGQSVMNLATSGTATLYAQWKPKTYTVNFIGNGNTGGSMSPQTITYNVETPLTLNGFTRTGYTFKEWNNLASGSGLKSFNDGESVKNLVNSGTYTLYAQWTANTYTVQFNSNGGTGGSTNSMTLTFDKAKDLNANGFTRPGYYFVGWNTDKDGKGTSYSNRQSVKNLTAAPNGTVTLYAQWAESTYTVEFDPGDGTGTMEPQIMHSDVSEALKANTFTYLGHKFSNWRPHNISGSVISYKDKQSVVNLADRGETIVLRAYWTYVGTFTVKFDANGGTGSISSQTITVGETAALPLNNGQMTRAGYTFAGWKDGSGNFYADGADTGPTGSKSQTVTLSAQWTPIAYTVKFEPNGGTGSMDDMTMNYGEAKNLTSNAFTCTGCSFAGWSTTQDGDAAYSDGASVSNLTTTAGDTVKLYAQWTPITYTVQFNANGGTGSMTSQTLTYGKAETLKPNSFSYTGYTFAGWKVGNAGALIANNASTPNLTTTAGDTVTLYAQWTPITYTINFDANGGTGSTASMSMSYGETKTLTPNGFSVTGYSFLGWSLTKDGDVKYTDGASVSNLTAAAGGSITLYAQWKAPSYIVEYLPGFLEGEGGGSMADQEIPVGQLTRLSINKYYRPGYTFDGWKDAGGKSYADGADAPNGTKDQTITLTAQWKESKDFIGWYTKPKNPDDPDDRGVLVLVENDDGKLVFAGQNVSGEDGTVYIENGAWAYSGTSLDLYARFAQYCAITLKSPGAEPEEQLVKAILNEPYEDRAMEGYSKPEKEENTLKGWYWEDPETHEKTRILDAEGKPTPESKELGWVDENYKWKKEGPVDLTAEWADASAKLITVPLYDCGTDPSMWSDIKNGSEAGSATVYQGDSNLNEFNPNLPTYEGYKPDGWYTPDGKKVLNEDGTFASDNVPGWIEDGKWIHGSDDVALIAHWVEDTKDRYTLTLKSGDRTIWVGQAEENTEYSALTNVPAGSGYSTYNGANVKHNPEEGYSLIGWYTASNQTDGIWLFLKNGTISEGSASSSGNIVMSWNYTQEIVTTKRDNNGDVTSSEIVTKDYTSEQKLTRTRTEEIKGNTTVTTTYTFKNVTFSLKGDATLYACWQNNTGEDKYEVLDSDGVWESGVTNIDGILNPQQWNGKYVIVWVDGDTTLDKEYQRRVDNHQNTLFTTISRKRNADGSYDIVPGSVELIKNDKGNYYVEVQSSSPSIWNVENNIQVNWGNVWGYVIYGTETTDGIKYPNVLGTRPATDEEKAQGTDYSIRLGLTDVADNINSAVNTYFDVNTTKGSLIWNYNSDTNKLYYNATVGQLLGISITAGSYIHYSNTLAGMASNPFVVFSQYTLSPKSKFYLLKLDPYTFDDDNVNTDPALELVIQDSTNGNKTIKFKLKNNGQTVGDLLSSDGRTYSDFVRDSVRSQFDNSDTSLYAWVKNCKTTSAGLLDNGIDLFQLSGSASQIYTADGFASLSQADLYDAASKCENNTLKLYAVYQKNHVFKKTTSTFSDGGLYLIVDNYGLGMTIRGRFSSTDYGKALYCKATQQKESTAPEDYLMTQGKGFDAYSVSGNGIDLYDYCYALSEGALPTWAWKAESAPDGGCYLFSYSESSVKTYLYTDPVEVAAKLYLTPDNKTSWYYTGVGVRSQTTLRKAALGTNYYSFITRPSTYDAVWSSKADEALLASTSYQLSLFQYYESLYFYE